MIDLVSSADGRFAASIAEQERCINVWSCEVVGNAGDIALPPTVVLTTESNVTSVAFSQDANLLVACTESGAVNVWREPAVAPHATSTDSAASKKKRQRKAALQSKPCDCDVRVLDAAATGTTIPTIQATFAAATGESGAQLLLAYGGLIRPTFEAVAIEGENEDSEMTILLKSVTLKRTKNTTSVLVDRESVKQMLVGNYRNGRRWAVHAI